MSKQKKQQHNPISYVFCGLILLGLLSTPIVQIIIALFLFLKIIAMFSPTTKVASNSACTPEKQQVENDIRIMTESQDLVHNSNNIETVVFRFETLLETLKRLAEYENDPTLQFTKERPSQVLEELKVEKIEIMNDAVERAYRKVIEDSKSLKTESGKVNRIKKFFSKLDELSPKFPNETNAFIQNLKQKENITTDETVNQRKSTGSSSQVKEPMNQVKVQPVSPKTSKDIQLFYELSNQIQKSKDIHEKLTLCGKSFPLLPDFIENCKKENFLPPSILCRDLAPELCMRLGEWGKARKTIEFCVNCSAYGETITENSNGKEVTRLVFHEGTSVLELLAERKLAASVAYAYIQSNPGTLQSKIYKVPELAHVSSEALKWFCRNSNQIRKEKEGNTNKLYVNDSSA